MTSFLLAAAIFATSSTVMEQVHTIRIETSPGTIELSTAVAISSNHALSLCTFPPDNIVTIETSSGFFCPDSLIISSDLGLVVLAFDEEIFDSYQTPSNIVPETGETLSIIGQGLSGLLSAECTVSKRYPDGSILLTSGTREGLMGAAVFNSDDKYIGVITGIIRPDSPLPQNDNRDYLVLYPSQIWYMWAKLATLPEEYTEYPFGVTALSSISLTCSRSSGIYIVSVAAGSIAWETGLRPGDLITHIDGTPVYHPETLRGLLILSKDSLRVRVLRDEFERIIIIPQFNPE